MTTMQAGTGSNGAPPPGTGALAKKSKADTFKSFLEERRSGLAAVLPKHITADRMVRLALAAGLKNPKLFDCSKESVWLSVLTLAQLGLDCGGVLGSAYLVPFENSVKDPRTGAWSKRLDCQPIIGYRGMIDLARRSGQIESIKAVPVFKGDTFTVTRGIDDTVVHIEGADRIETFEHFVAAYGVAKFKGGGYHLEVMSKRQILEIKAKSKGATGPNAAKSPWNTDFVQMALKTVIRRMFKWLPMSVEQQDTLDRLAEKSPETVGDIIDVVATEVDTETGEISGGDAPQGGAQGGDPSASAGEGDVDGSSDHTEEGGTSSTVLPPVGAQQGVAEKLKGRNTPPKG